MWIRNIYGTAAQHVLTLPADIKKIAGYQLGQHLCVRLNPDTTLTICPLHLVGLLQPTPQKQNDPKPVPTTKPIRHRRT